MKRLLYKFIKKKNRGQSDLICSLFVLVALIAILFLSVGVVKDISKVTLVDQVARQAIIKLETQGNINEDIESIKEKLEDSDLIFEKGHTLQVNGQSISDGVYVAYKDNGNWVIDSSKNHVFGYGEEAAVYIQCQAQVFSFGGNIFGGNQTEQYTTITRLKASITKNAN